MKLRAIRERQPRDLDARFRIVRVDVDDRDLEAARQPARVRRAVGILGARREPELVVDDDVDRAAGAVPGKSTADSASPRRRPDPGNAASPWIRIGRLTAGSKLGAPPAITAVPAARAMPTTTGIDGLEVARVGRHRDDEVQRFSAFDRAMRAGVILHVAGPRHVLAERCRDETGSLNSARICAYGLLSTCAMTLSRPRCAIPTRCAPCRPRPLRRSPRRGSAPACRCPRSRTASCRGTCGAGSARKPPPATAGRAARSDRSDRSGARNCPVSAACRSQRRSSGTKTCA